MASIIRRGEESRAGRDERTAVFNFDDVARRAETYLKGVKAQAAGLIAQAENDAARIREQARVEGLQQARKEANAGVKALVAEQMKAVIPSFQQQFDAIANERDTWLHRWEKDAVKLAIRIASRVTTREVEKDPGIVINLVREALELISSSHQIEIQLNPKDRESLSEQLDDIVAGLRRVATVTFVDDSQLQRGGCRITSEHGEIDQDIETRLERISEELLSD